jgi:hydroxymethylpyrimidine pyrophosphatase-like HAD family hydrolase
MPEPPLVVYTMDQAARVQPHADSIRKALADCAIVQALFQPRHDTDPMALEVHGPTATKWHALVWLLAQWRVPAEQVVAIGDDVNDIPMLRAAGLSFAMGNAAPEVKEAAARVTTSNDQDGAARALWSVFPELGGGWSRPAAGEG